MISKSASKGRFSCESEFCNWLLIQQFSIERFIDLQRKAVHADLRPGDRNLCGRANDGEVVEQRGNDAEVGLGADQAVEVK